MMRESEAMGWGRGRWFPWGVIVLVSALAQLWCLGSVFFMDDFGGIQHNSLLESGRWWDTRLKQWTYLCFQVQKAVWGDWAPGYHAVNWLLHTGVGLVLFGFVRSAWKGGGATGVALVAALLFVAHPLGSEIPNYARTQDLAWVTLFSVSGAWVGVRLLERFSVRDLIVFVLCGIGATVSKGPGLPHFLMIVGFGMLACFERKNWEQLRRYWWVGVVVVLLVGGFVWWQGWVDTFFKQRAQHESASYRWHPVTLCRVFWKFVGLLFVPKGLCADHFIAATVSWEDPEAVPAVVGVGGWMLAATGLMIWRKTRLLGMCLWLFVGAIAVRVFYYINEFMPEYRIYPGLPFIFLAVAIVGWWVWRKLPEGAPRVVARVGTGGLVGLLCLFSAQRSFRWHSLEALCGDTLEQYPWQGRALWMLQRERREAGEWEEIVRESRGFNEIGAAFSKEQRRIAPGQQLASGHLAMADVACRGYLAEALAELGQPGQGLAVMKMMEQHLERMGVDREDDAVIWEIYHHGLGRTLERAGYLDRALEELEKTNGKDHRAVDIRRVRAKLAEKERGAGA